jgi:hypothetical protein
MAEGFYERLGVGEGASLEEIKTAYQRKLAELVRRLRTARRRGADVSILEGRERALREAMDVLQDTNRRRRYDAFLENGREGLPEDADQLWVRARNSMVDPVAAAALASVQELTDLPTGDPLPEIRQSLADSPPKAVFEPQILPEVAEVEDPAFIRFSEEGPTVADEHRPATAQVQWEDAGPSIGTLDAPLPEAQADLFDEDPAPAMARVDLRAVAPAEPVPEEAALDGRFLAGIREEKGMSLDELAATTRISARYLEAIEENAFDKLPAAPFVRGYVRQVAQILGVEDQGVVEGFMDMYNHHRG